MTAVVAQFAPTPGMPYARRLAQLLRQRAWHIGTLTVLLAAVDFLRVFHITAGRPEAPFVLVAAEILGHWFVRCTGLMVAICACEATMLAGPKRAILQAAAVFSSAAATSYGLEVFLFGNAQIRATGIDDTGFFAYALWLQLCSAALLSWYYQAQGESSRFIASLRAAELARQRARKSLLESRLAIVKAQVEPEFLLETLARVQELYEIDAARADRVLEDLIDYLRAALPQLRERSTTLGREVDLVDAYLRIVAASASPLRSTIAALDAAKRGEYAPPMVLLPLAQLAVSYAAAACDGIAIGFAAHAGEHRVEMEFNPRSSFAADERLDAVRRTLDSIFGAAASLDVVQSATRARIGVRWPRNEPPRTP